jgi:uncharacterized protein (TIGR02246 family)
MAARPHLQVDNERERHGMNTRLLVLVFTAIAVNRTPTWAQSSAENASEQTALRMRADAYVEAFNKGDAATLASFWTGDAELVEQSGRHIKGRKAIEASYQALFSASKGGKLRINAGTDRFVKPDLVIEDGTTEITRADDGPPTTASYTAVLLKQEGKWYLVSLHEMADIPPSNFEHLQDLAWIVGNWTDEAGKSEVASVSYTWADNQNFLVSKSRLAVKDVPVAGQTQWIAWDAAAKQIRGWSFQSGGAVGEAIWTEDGGKWTIKTSATLRDGKKILATNVLTTVDADHFTWQSTQRSLDGQPLPDTPLIKMKRIH